jgi:hypothetical protein
LATGINRIKTDTIPIVILQIKHINTSLSDAPNERLLMKEY